MDNFTVPQVHGLSISLREEGDDPDPTPDATKEATIVDLIDDSAEKSYFPQVSNLFIVIIVILVVAFFISFLLRRRRMRARNAPHGRGPTHVGHMPSVPDGTNSLYPEGHTAYHAQPLSPSSAHAQGPYPSPNPPYSNQQQPHYQQPYPSRQHPQHTFVPFS